MAGLLDLVGDILGGNSQSKAISNASTAQQQATQQALNLASTEYADTRTGELPYETTGTSAESRLAQMYGLADGGTVTATGIQGGVNAGANLDPNATKSALVNTLGGYNATDTAAWDQYLKDAPDVAASYQAQLNNPGFKANFPTPEAFAAWYQQNQGAALGRAAPTPTIGAAAPANTNIASATPATDPNADFYLSPDYQFAFNRGLGGVQASAAANGMSDSGAARKAEIEFSSGLATQQYQNYANRLMSLAGSGQAAASQQAAANQNYTSTAGNLLTTGAQDQASAILGKSAVNTNTTNQLIGGVDSIGQTLLSSFG